MIGSQASYISDRKNADDMDDERNANIVFMYLCRLEEARTWMKHVIQKSYNKNENISTEYINKINKLLSRLPEPGVQLEQSLRDGVLISILSLGLLNFDVNTEKLPTNLKKLNMSNVFDIGQNYDTFFKMLSNRENGFFHSEENYDNYEELSPDENCPPETDISPVKSTLPISNPTSPTEPSKIRNLHFKHTDNINIFLKTCQFLGLRSFYLPETTDIYDCKNIPRLIYSVHTLAHLLYNKNYGTPSIQNISEESIGFTTQQISEMERALQELGILDSLPQFHKIGGLIKKEVSRDEAKEYAALLAINLAIDEQNLGKFSDGVGKFKDVLGFNIVDLEFDEDFVAKLVDLKMNKTPKIDETEEELCLLGMDEIQEELDMFYFNRAVDVSDQGVFQRILARFNLEIPASHSEQKYFKAFLSEKESLGDFSRPTVHDLFHSIQESNDRANQWLQLESDGTIAKIQANIRTYNTRKKYQKRLTYLNSLENEAVTIQRAYRYMKLRERADYFMENEGRIVFLQRKIKNFLYQRRLQKISLYLVQVVKIQTWYRKCVWRKAYKDLLNSSIDRPVKVKNLVKFLPIYMNNLEKSKSEAILIKQLKTEILMKIKNNEEKEGSVRSIEKKTSCLINNRKTVEDLHELKKKVKKKGGDVNQFVIDDQKNKNEMLAFIEKCENLVGYLTYEKPIILAHLLNEMSHVKSSKFYMNVVMNLYSKGGTEQELFMMVKLMVEMLKQEFQKKLENGDGKGLNASFLSSFHTIYLLIHKFCRTHTETHEKIKMLLKSTCENIITESIKEVKNLSFFESINDFQKIGKSPSIIGSKSIRSGSFTESMSKASLESNGSQVLDIPENCLAIVSEKMKQHVDEVVKVLRQKGGVLLPFHVKWVCFEFQKLILKNLPDSEIDPVKITAQIICEKLLAPVINAPDGFSLFKTDHKNTDNKITEEELVPSGARKLLGLVSSLFTRCAKRELYNEERYPRESICFNNFIREKHLDICKFVRKEVLSFTIEDSPQSFYKISDYSTETLVKPTVNLKIRELLELLKTSEKHVEPSFRLKKIPGPEFFDGPKNKSPSKTEKLEKIDNVNTLDTQITLNLRFDKQHTFDETNYKLQEKLAKLKENIVKLLPEICRIQPKMTDLDAFFEFRKDSKISEGLVKILEKIDESCQELKSAKMLPEYSAYRTLCHLIRTNIVEVEKTRRIRRSEIEVLRANLQDLVRKSEFINGQIDIFNDYYQNSLSDQQAKSDKNNKKDKQKKHEHTARELHSKKIILSVGRIPVVQYKNVTITMKNIKSDVFHVKIVYKKENIFDGTFESDVLYDAMAKQIEKITLFDTTVGGFEVDANRMLFFVNKNFLASKK